jgi:hypothetical protein
MKESIAKYLLGSSGVLQRFSVMSRVSAYVPQCLDRIALPTAFPLMDKCQSNICGEFRQHDKNEVCISSQECGVPKAQWNVHMVGGIGEGFR